MVWFDGWFSENKLFTFISFWISWLDCKLCGLENHKMLVVNYQEILNYTFSMYTLYKFFKQIAASNVQCTLYTGFPEKNGHIIY